MSGEAQYQVVDQFDETLGPTVFALDIPTAPDSKQIDAVIIQVTVADVDVNFTGEDPATNPFVTIAVGQFLEVTEYPDVKNLRFLGDTAVLKITYYTKMN